MAARAGAADPASAGTAGTRTAPFASAWRREHLTADERVARGTAARAKAPRSAHGQWAPAPDRPDPIALLEEQAESRVAELVPIRYGRMLVSPFTSDQNERDYGAFTAAVNSGRLTAQTGL
jgi:hypothetical protein